MMPHLIDIERRLRDIAGEPPNTVTFEAGDSTWTIDSKKDGLTLRKDNIDTKYSEIRTTLFNDNKFANIWDPSYGTIHEFLSERQLVNNINMDTIKDSMTCTDLTKPAIDTIKSRLIVPILKNKCLIFQYVTPVKPDKPYRAHMDTVQFEIYLNEPTATTIIDTEPPHRNSETDQPNK